MHCPGLPPGCQGGLPSFSPEPGVLSALGAGGPWPVSMGNWAGEAISAVQWPWRASLEPGQWAGRPSQSRLHGVPGVCRPAGCPGPTESSGHGGAAVGAASGGEQLDGGPAPSSGSSPLGLAPSPSSAHCPSLAVGSFCPIAHPHGGSCEHKGEGAPVASWEAGAPGCFLRVTGGTCGVGGAPSSGVAGMSLGSRGPHWWGRGSWDAGIGVPGGQRRPARGLPAAPP